MISLRDMNILDVMETDVAPFDVVLDTFYRDRYIQASRQHEELRRKIQGESEQEIEEMNNQKRQLERKVNKNRYITRIKKRKALETIPSPSAFLYLCTNSVWFLVDRGEGRER